MVFKVLAWAIQGSYSVFISPMYTGGIPVIKLLLIFLLLICLVSLQKVLSQESRKRGIIIFPPLQKQPTFLHLTVSWGKTGFKQIYRKISP